MNEKIQTKASGVTIDQLPPADSAQSGDLLEVQRGSQSLKITTSQMVKLSEESLDLNSNATIREIRNDLNDLSNKKYAIICVAGQSNAVGYDESPVDPYFYSNGIDYRRIKQLGFKGNDNLKVIPLGHCAQNYQDMSGFTNPANPTLLGSKGMHLPLAIDILKYIPDNLDVLILPCAYGGTGFTSGTVGTYDESTKKPSANARKWGRDTPFYKSMRDRIKFALDLNPDNIFFGVVWLQGENDKDNAAGHFAAFQEMTDAFFEEMNQNYRNRVKKGVWDRDLWFNIETVSYWYGQGQCQQIWNNYKKWNPNSYVTVSREAPSNEVNGTGATASVRAAHYGNNAYNKFVVPNVIRALISLNYPSVYSAIMDARGIDFDNSGSHGVLKSVDVNSAINEIVNKLSGDSTQIISDTSTVSSATVNASAPAGKWLVNKITIIPAGSKGTKLRYICRWDVNSRPTATLSLITVDSETNKVLTKTSASGTFKQDGSYGNRWYFEFEFTNNSGKDIFIGFQCNNNTTFNALQGRANSAYMGTAELNVGSTIPASNAPWMPEFDLVHEESVKGDFMANYVSVAKLKEIVAQSTTFDQFKSAVASL